MAYNRKYAASKNSERETPDKLFSLLNDEFNFTLDAAATYTNRKCEQYIDAGHDALSIPWITSGNIWLNPPYSRSVIGPFLEHAWRMVTMAEPGHDVVCLVPADPSTRWWRDNVLDCGMHMQGIEVEIRFLTPRVRFLLDGVPMKGGAMTPNAIVIYRKAVRTSGNRYTRYWNWDLNKYY